MNLLSDYRMLGSPLDTARLPDLWHRRAELSGDEMGCMYQLVWRALCAYYPSELRSLREDKEELIAQFIYSKVLRLDGKGTDSYSSLESAPSTPSAICAYFRRYLIDCLRSASHRRNISIEAEDIAADLDTRAHSLEDPVQAVLRQHGLDEARVRRDARAFIGALDEPDRIILAASLGSHSDAKGGLKRIAEQHRVPSYHHRALKLGVTLKKTAERTQFARTKIGHWLSDVLGIEINADNSQVILTVLNLLGAESSA